MEEAKTASDFPPRLGRIESTVTPNSQPFLGEQFADPGFWAAHSRSAGDVIQSGSIIQSSGSCAARLCLPARPKASKRQHIALPKRAGSRPHSGAATHLASGLTRWEPLITGSAD